MSRQHQTLNDLFNATATAIINKMQDFTANYQAVEYIHSNRDAYINTNYIFENPQLRVKTKWLKNVSLAANVFGVDKGNLPRQLHGAIYNNNLYLGNSSWLPNFMDFALNTIYEQDVRITNTGVEVIINGKIYSKEGLNGWDGASIPDFLFASNSGSGSTFQMNGNIYYWIAYDDNDKIVRYLVPCYRKSDSKIGMYDLCNSICPLTGTPFYISANSSEFTKGNDIDLRISADDFPFVIDAITLNDLLPSGLKAVDLGTLNWTRLLISSISETYAFESSAFPIKFKAGSNAFICLNYTCAGNTRNNLTSDKTMTPWNHTTDSYFGIRDDSYTDATAFKQAMNGVILIYKTAD